MPCGCNKGKQQEFVFTDPSGKSTVYDNELKAKVAQIRAGGGGTITSRPKG
jgi:hypothetical protein